MFGEIALSILIIAAVATQAACTNPMLFAPQSAMYSIMLHA